MTLDKNPFSHGNVQMPSKIELTLTRVSSELTPKSTSPQLLRSQDLDQLLRLGRGGNDTQYKVYWLSYAVIKMICLTSQGN